MKRGYIILLITLYSVAGCKPKLKTGAGEKGSADFSVSLAIGSSHTAGYADNSLYRSGQQNGYANILADQFKLAGGGNFNQPLLPGESGYPYDTTLALNRLVLGYSTGCDGVTSLLPVPYRNVDTSGSNNSIVMQGPYNNLGVPGLRVADCLLSQWALIAASQHAPYATRFYHDVNERPVEELSYTISKLNPTFFTVWLGNDDVLLGYAAKGGGQGSANTMPIISGTDTLITPNDITPLSVFTGEYDSVIKVLTKNGAKGALLNIPDLASLPFFTTVPVNALKLTQLTAAALNLAYPSGSGIHFDTGANYFVIQDHLGNIRQVKDGEYILLSIPQDSLKCAGWGSTKPIPSKYVLTADEVANTRSATSAFNMVIQKAATAHNLAYVDINSFLTTVSMGVVYSGVTYSETFVSGGTFSLDGIHFTPRGNAIIANQVIQAINAKYSSSVPMTDVNKYPGIKFP